MRTQIKDNYGENTTLSIGSEESYNYVCLYRSPESMSPIMVFEEDFDKVIDAINAFKKFKEENAHKLK